MPKPAKRTNDATSQAQQPISTVTASEDVPEKRTRQKAPLLIEKDDPSNYLLRRYRECGRRTSFTDTELRQWFAKNPRSELRVHICNVFRRLIAMGTLKPGDTAPSVSRLAEVLDLHRSVVGYAYAELTKEGTFRGVRGAAVYVLNPEPARRILANDFLMESITHCRQIGLTKNEILEVFKSQLAEAYAVDT